MTERHTVEHLLQELHAARLEGQLERLCALFAPQARLRIVGASDGKPIVISANGLPEIRTWLAMLVKAFRLSDYQRLSLLVDGERAAAHWRAQIRSKITGAVVPTELVDLIQTRAGRIVAHDEFFVPG